LDPERTHQRLVLAEDRRSVVHKDLDAALESGYFSASIAQQEVPLTGTHRYSFQFFSEKPDVPGSQDYWGAISVCLRLSRITSFYSGTGSWC